MGAIAQYLIEDHARLDEALRRAIRQPPHLDRKAYAEFREGLLRHIGMEEKILFSTARAAQGGKPLPAAARLRLHHAALGALLVLTPTNAVIEAIRLILRDHNPLEEDPGGVYEQCEKLIGTGSSEVLTRLRNSKPVAVAPYNDTTIAVESARASLKRAGYTLEIL